MDYVKWWLGALGTNHEITAESFVKKWGLGANDGAMGLEVASAAADSHIGELLAEEEIRERRIYRCRAKLVYHIVFPVAITTARRRGGAIGCHGSVYPACKGNY